MHKPLVWVAMSASRPCTRARQLSASVATKATTTIARSRDTRRSQLPAATATRTRSGYPPSSITVGLSKARTRKPLARAVTLEARLAPRPRLPCASVATRMTTTTAHSWGTQISRRPAKVVTLRSPGRPPQGVTIRRMPSRSNPERTRNTETTARPVMTQCLALRSTVRTRIVSVATTAITHAPKWMTSTARSATTHRAPHPPISA